MSADTIPTRDLPILAKAMLAQADTLRSAGDELTALRLRLRARALARLATDAEQQRKADSPARASQT